jgi:hypothetical protein
MQSLIDPVVKSVGLCSRIGSLELLGVV